MKCPKCSSRDIDFQESTGQSICVNCGTILEENTIISNIEFQESGERSHVIGQYISATCSKPYSGGSNGRPLSRHGESRDTRDATLVNARRSISQVASTLRLQPLYVDRAYRLYQLALQRNFIFGRKQLHVVATCLYIICRQEKSPHLLIDFSDALQINVYVLGKSFLQFSKVLNLNLPVVDPSLYIHRYATRLDLGESRASVLATALRVITRLKKDWIAIGRRPDGICALAMLVSTRAHGFNISQEVVCKLFRISSDLLRRRLSDFRQIPAAQLTLEQFHSANYDSVVEYDPPAYIRNVIESLELEQKDWKASMDDDHQCDEIGNITNTTNTINTTTTTSTSAAAMLGPKMIRLNLPPSSSSSIKYNAAAAASGNSEGLVVGTITSSSLEKDEIYQTIPPSQYTTTTSNMKEQQYCLDNNNKNIEEENDTTDDSGDDIDQYIKPNCSHPNESNLPKTSQTIPLNNINNEKETSSGFQKTQIGDIEVFVPIPGSNIHTKKRKSELMQSRIQSRKELYGQIYQDVIERISIGCINTTSNNDTSATNDGIEDSRKQKALEALQQEADLVEEGNTCIGGWGTIDKKHSKIKERKLVLYVETSGNTTTSSTSNSNNTLNRSKAISNKDIYNSSSTNITSNDIIESKTNNDTNNNNMVVIDADTLNNNPTTTTTTTTTTAASTTVAGDVGISGVVDMIHENEWNRYILTEEEQKKRSVIWEKSFRPFMDDREQRKLAKEREIASNGGVSDRYTQSGKLRRKYAKKLTTTSTANTNMDSNNNPILSYQPQLPVLKSSSKKINYDALKGFTAAPLTRTNNNHNLVNIDAFSTQTMLNSTGLDMITGVNHLISSNDSSFSNNRYTPNHTTTALLSLPTTTTSSIPIRNPTQRISTSTTQVQVAKSNTNYTQLNNKSSIPLSKQQQHTNNNDNVDNLDDYEDIEEEEDMLLYDNDVYDEYEEEY